MKHFLLTYNRKHGFLVDLATYDLPTTAERAYCVAEDDAASDPDIEVVLLGADSIETLRHTHGHYFEGA